MIKKTEAEAVLKEIKWLQNKTWITRQGGPFWVFSDEKHIMSGIRLLLWF